MKHTSAVVWGSPLDLVGLSAFRADRGCTPVLRPVCCQFPGGWGGMLSGGRDLMAIASDKSKTSEWTESQMYSRDIWLDESTMAGVRRASFFLWPVLPRHPEKPYDVVVDVHTQLGRKSRSTDGEWYRVAPDHNYWLKRGENAFPKRSFFMKCVERKAITAFNDLTKKRPSPPPPEPADDGSPSDEPSGDGRSDLLSDSLRDMLGDPTEMARLWPCFKRLSLDDREMLRMRYFEFMTFREIASATGQTESKVKSRHRAALNQLQACVLRAAMGNFPAKGNI